MRVHVIGSSVRRSALQEIGAHVLGTQRTQIADDDLRVIVGNCHRERPSDHGVLTSTLSHPRLCPGGRLRVVGHEVSHLAGTCPSGARRVGQTPTGADGNVARPVAIQAVIPARSSPDHRRDTRLCHHNRHRPNACNTARRWLSFLVQRTCQSRVRALRALQSPVPLPDRSQSRRPVRSEVPLVAVAVARAAGASTAGAVQTARGEPSSAPVRHAHHLRSRPSTHGCPRAAVRYWSADMRH
eukprot:1525796-Prymnesium_polylepis.1